MNKVILIGRVGENPIVKTFDDGKKAHFSLATTEKGYTKRDGTLAEAVTTWHRVVVKFSKLAENVEKYVKKGDLLCVEGSIENRTYQTQAGETRTITEIIAKEVRFLISKKEAAQTDPSNDFPS